MRSVPCTCDHLSHPPEGHSYNFLSNAGCYFFPSGFFEHIRSVAALFLLGSLHRAQPLSRTRRALIGGEGDEPLTLSLAAAAASVLLLFLLLILLLLLLVPMEALQPLSTNDSFSYSWLINVKPSSLEALEDAVMRLSFDAADGDPFIEIDPWLASLRRASLDFDFGLSGSQSPVLAHAEEIFSNGLILPLPLVNPSRKLQQQQQQAESAPGSSDSDESALSRSVSLDSSRLLLSLSNRYKVSLSSSSPRRFRSAQGRPLPLDLSRRPGGGPKLPFLRTCGRTSKRLLQKYLCFLMPLYRKVKGLKLVWRAEGSSVIVPSVTRSCAASLDASPRISIDAPTGGDDRCQLTRALVDTGAMEKSIHDAVLHCKKSIGESRQAGSELCLGRTAAEDFRMYLNN